MEHPITPPSELVEEWDRYADALNSDPAVYIATQAARWGADQELEASCKAITGQIITIDNIGLSGPAGVLHTETCSSWPAFAQMVSRQLHAARRPKPPSLKQQALEALNEERGDMSIVNYNTIRSVLESLPDPQD